MRVILAVAGTTLTGQGRAWVPVAPQGATKGKARPWNASIAWRLPPTEGSPPYGSRSEPAAVERTGGGKLEAVHAAEEREQDDDPPKCRRQRVHRDQVAEDEADDDERGKPGEDQAGQLQPLLVARRTPSTAPAR